MTDREGNNQTIEHPKNGQNRACRIESPNHREISRLELIQGEKPNLELWEILR